MIKHVVMWKLSDFAENKPKQKNAIEVQRVLNDLTGKITEIKKYEVGINESTSDNAYDVVLYSEFNSWDDLKKYKEHPEHVKAADFLAKVKFETAVVDYEV
jgi:hypothetical protein